MIDNTVLLNWIGGALVGVLIWLALGIFKRLDKIDAEAVDIKRSIAAEISSLKELYHSINERLIRLEERDKIMGSPSRPARVTDLPVK